MADTLLIETIEALTREGLTDTDVQWVGSTEAWFDWSDFARLADAEGDAPGDLVVVGKDWWIDRLGANKGWTLSVQRKEVPARPAVRFVPATLFGRDTTLPDDGRELFSLRADIEALRQELVVAKAQTSGAQQELQRVALIATQALGAIAGRPD